MIEIYADPSIGRVFVRVRFPVGPSSANQRHYWLGWDRTAAIWQAMEEAVASFICLGINLVTADGETIMQVPDFANRALIEELQNLKSKGWTDDSAQGIYQSARALAAITEAKRSADKLVEDEKMRKAHPQCPGPSAKQESTNA